MKTFNAICRDLRAKNMLTDESVSERLNNVSNVYYDPDERPRYPLTNWEYVSVLVVFFGGFTLILSIAIAICVIILNMIYSYVY
jgi:hypothetical protein